LCYRKGHLRPPISLCQVEEQQRNSGRRRLLQRGSGRPDGHASERTFRRSEPA